MGEFAPVVAGAVVAGLLLGACASGGKTSRSESPEPEPIVGPTTQAEILAEMPEWVGDLVRAEPDEVWSRRLAEPVDDAEVVVFFGTWCSDSRRELTRLWRAVEMAGGDLGFPIRYVGVDRTKSEPEDLLEGKEILYVPTLIVVKSGIESGRIVESAPEAIEKDLVALLTGEADGWLSGRDDLDGSGAAATP
ncbi:MAG: thioredoxin family protein [bacterium]|nr:thioredoxin family protein [bacterium]